MMEDDAQEFPNATPQEREELERELKQHDWTYHFSDSNAVFNKGATKEIELKNRALRINLYPLFLEYKRRSQP